ncbi:hypothetical protein [uncultured Eubacterium sp.]|uniref:hypothetical protein n=1 Tax=uncultured Eubacterium sp. TaxID=165185 RepID=UPI0025D4C62F|nr:hypothetical protein [uncultured Eubacterium sp.]
MKKMFKKSIAMLIAVLMVISAMPITALASDNNLQIKTNVKIAGYENQYGLMYYNSGNKVDYILSVIKEANSDGVITVKKGSNLTVTQSFGTWTNVDNSAAGDTNIASNGLKWHYGNGTDYAIASVLNHDNKTNVWNAYISGDTSKAIQSSVGGTMANKSVQNSLRSTASEGAVNEATGIYTMTPETFPQLNTPGEYKIDLWSTVSLMNWKYNFPTTRWCSIYGTQNPVTITIRVTDDYTFEKANGHKTIISDISKDNALKKAPALDSDTKKIPNNDGTHSWTEYSWVETSESYFKETGATRNGQCNYGAETSETVTEPTCNKAGLKKYTKTCTECGHESVRTEDIPATGEHNYGTPVSVDATNHKYVCSVCGDEKLEAHDTLGDGGKCSKCGYIPLNLDAYNAANQVVLSNLSKDKDKYTKESLDKYQAAVQPYLGKQNEFTSQDEVDAATAAIVSADVLLQKKRITIKFVVEKEDGTSFTKDSKTADWGKSVNLDTQSNYVSKWTITVNGVTSKMDSNATAIDHIATEDATITAYVSNDETETVKYSKVTFLGKNSAVVGIKYVVAGKTVETDTLLTVPAIPFYENGKWDKAKITTDGSDITVRATYVPKAGDEKKCGIHFKGDTKYYNYDSYVYLFNADKSKKYAMYADADETQLITYFDGVDFYAPRRDNLYIKEVPDTSAMTATIGFTGSYKQDTTSSFNVKFWLPEGATLVETGVDLVAKFPDGTVKSAHDRATKFSERNEYTYSAKFSDSKKTIEFKPYLTYKNGGTTTTVYGASQTVEY